MLHHALYDVEGASGMIPCMSSCVHQSDDEEPTWSRLSCSWDFHELCPKWCLERD